MSVEKIHDLTAIDPWFLDHLAEIVDLENQLRLIGSIDQTDDDLLRRAKQFGFSDRQLATLWDMAEMEVRDQRKKRGIVATFKVCRHMCRRV